MNLPEYNMVLSNMAGPDGIGIIVSIKESINYTEVIFNTDFKELVLITEKIPRHDALFECIYR